MKHINNILLKIQTFINMFKNLNYKTSNNNPPIITKQCGFNYTNSDLSYHM